MKESVVLGSVLFVVAMMLISCASESGATATTKRHTTTTTPDHGLPNQALDYRDNNPETFWPTSR
jgi:hypothetical protein